MGGTKKSYPSNSQVSWIGIFGQLCHPRYQTSKNTFTWDPRPRAFRRLRPHPSPAFVHSTKAWCLNFWCRNWLSFWSRFTLNGWQRAIWGCDNLSTLSRVEDRWKSCEEGCGEAVMHIYIRNRIIMNKLSSSSTFSDHLTNFLKHFKTSLHSHISFIESCLEGCPEG